MEAEQRRDPRLEIGVERDDRGDRPIARRIINPKSMVAAGVGDDKVSAVEAEVILSGSTYPGWVNLLGMGETRWRSVEENGNGNTIRLPK